MTDFFGLVHTYRGQLDPKAEPIIKPDTKLISITANDLFMRSNYQDIQRYTEIDLAIAGDAEATLPSLTEAVRSLLTDDRRRLLQDRGKSWLRPINRPTSRRSKQQVTAGMPAPSAPPACRPSCGTRSRTRIGPWLPTYRS